LSHSSGNLDFPNLNVNLPEWRPAKEKIAYIPQRIPRWFGVLRDNLQFKASIHGIKGEENIKKVDELLELLGLTEYANHKWTEISTGYRLRFELARMLVGEPQLLILDEPIANLDINAQQKFLSDLQYFVKNSTSGLSVILSSQQLHEIESFSDNIIFLKQGKSLYTGAIKDFGLERSENTFEISSDLSLASFTSLFSSEELKSIQQIGNKLVFNTKTELNSSAILERLLQNKVNISYFRDISQSTKKLFN
jgi:ABC-2 type transport system ATP-binding protein